MHFATSPRGAGRAPPKQGFTQNSSTGKKTTCACDRQRIRVSGKPPAPTYVYIYMYMDMYVYAYVYVYARQAGGPTRSGRRPEGRGGLGVLWTS